VGGIGQVFSKDFEMVPSGPLKGIRIIEFAGKGAAPFAAMMLSDMGADVVLVHRKGAEPNLPIDIPSRGRVSIELDLKQASDRSYCLAAVAKADVLIEGFRPGVMERLGLGPEPVLEINPRLIYARMTGWGQTGPLAHAAGHDINYIALTGALAAFGPPGLPPPPPLNLVGDFGGGALFLAFGIAAALFERERSNQGQVIDAAMVDGTAALMAMYCGIAKQDPRALERGYQALGGAAPNYRCYECADGKFVAIGALEPAFYDLLLEKLGKPFPRPDDTSDPESWPDHGTRLAKIFKTRTRDEWRSILEASDACFAPVLSLDEAPDHDHMAARGVFVNVDGVLQPAPAPRFSRTPGRIQGPPPQFGAGGHERLAAWVMRT
jgi:alpha-methylacyl-CoA racemase